MSIFFILLSCDRATKQSPYVLTVEEREWMGKFFKDIMLEEGAIFTLCGSKPLTIIPVSLYSDEEMQAFFDQMSDEEKKNAVIVEDYDLPQNWEKWERIHDRFPTTKFLFFKKEDIDCDKVVYIYFVNILETIKVLKENYTVFRQETGLDFDPHHEVFDMEKGSEFWDQAHNNSVLMGLLYGFGPKNSFCFRDKYKGHDEADKPAQSLDSYFSDVHNFGTASVTNFPLPIFASFSDSKDEVIERYKMERVEIQKEYERHDFLDLTLQKLIR